MATFADKFLEDFNDFDDVAPPPPSTTTTTTTTTTNNDNNNNNNTSINNSNNEIDKENVMNEEETNIGDLDDLMISDEMLEKKQNELIAKLKDQPIEQVAKLFSSNKLLSLVKRVDEQMSEALPSKGIKTLQSGKEHQLIVECNSMVQEIQHEIYLIHKYIKEKYSKKFPELESSVHNPLDYINVVKRIGNENDLKNIELSDLLPRSTIMVLVVTLSSTTGKNLDEKEIDKVFKACDMAISLDEIKKKVLNYLESRMTYIAPNISILLGGNIASKLIGIAGSIQKLSMIPAGHIQTLGADKTILSGLSGVSNKKFQSGLISQCDLVKQAPPALKIKALRILTGRVSLAARIDAQQDSSLYGEMGRKYRDEIMEKIEKLQEPPPPKLDKALPAPDDTKKKKRGGERARRMKEKYQTTDLRKAQNRMAFNVEEKTIGDSGIGLGMVGGETGKLRLHAQDKGFLKKKKLEQKNYGSGSVGGGVTTAGAVSSMSGLQSVAITPAQGLLLSITQNDREAQLSNKSEKYFGSSSLKRKNSD